MSLALRLSTIMHIKDANEKNKTKKKDFPSRVNFPALLIVSVDQCVHVNMDV